MSLLQVKNLGVNFNTLEGTIFAVQGVSFNVKPRECLAIVGESGCGKSVSVRSILGLIPMPPGEVVSGEILFEGENLLEASNKRLREIRGAQISMIFQEPMTSLNPVFTIGQQVSEIFTNHRGMSKKQASAASLSMLKKVRIPSPKKRLGEYPHQLSGGMRQRVMIAMALACQPQILIADEPTTALDVTIQAQVMDLMGQLLEDQDTAILLITHDLGIVAETADRVIVMYAGKVVETGDIVAIFKDAKHPYTQGLLRSVPHLGRRSIHGKSRLKEIPGTVPSLLVDRPGCWFAHRCEYAMEKCREEEPSLLTVNKNHQARCWLCES